MAKPDSFDDIVESEVRDARKPKPAAPVPPPGMVGTVPAKPGAATDRREPRIRLLAPKGSTAAAFFFWFGIGDLVIAGLAALILLGNASIGPAVATVAGGVTTAMLWFGISTALDRLDAAAHWTWQTAEAIRQAEESRHG